MIIEVVLTIIAIIGAVLQYRSEHINIEEAKKKKYGLLLMIISILGLLGANTSKYVESQQSSNDIDTLKVKIDSSNQQMVYLNTELKKIQSKNDSLLISNEILRGLLEKTNHELDFLSIKTVAGLAQNQKSIETIGKASGARIVSQTDR
jgi:hypothetical protein